MERQEDILGLTLSELAFFIVLVLLLLPLIRNAVATGPENPPPVDITIENNRLKEENSELRESSDLKAQANLELKERLRVSQKEKPLTSRQTPTCIEFGIATGFLFRADIVGIDKYFVNRESVSLSQLRSRFSSDIAQASDVGCRHSIEVSYLEGMGVSDYRKSLDELQDFFYTKPLPPVPFPLR